MISARSNPEVEQSIRLIKAMLSAKNLSPLSYPSPTTSTMTIRNPPKPFVLNAKDIKNIKPTTFQDPEASGSVSWKTLISAPQTPTDTLTVGIATCAPGTSTFCRGDLKPHRHTQAELYHITRGEGIITIDGVEHRVGKGDVVWIPGDAEHGAVNSGKEDLVWLYVFAVDGFEKVIYRFDEHGVKSKL